MTTAAVDIIGIKKNFGAVTALKQVDFTIAEGEFVSLLGASGCGKSTLLRIISGFEVPSAGQIRIQGEDVTASPPERRPTNLVFQRGALFPHMSVRENIGYALKLRRWDRKRIDARVDEMLALVRLEGLGERRPTELSGGQSQRVAMARALAGEPKVLLLDEPLSALDLKLRQQMQLELRAIQRKLGATFIFVTHDQTEALVMSDRIAIMNGGRIEQSGTPQDIYKRPASIFVSDFIGQTNLLAGVVVDVGPKGVVLDVGGRRLDAAPAELAVGDKAVLSIRPEAVRLGQGNERPHEGRGVAATVAELIYLGSSFRAGCRLADDTMMWADLRDEEAEGLALGDSVALNWSQGAARLLKGGTQ
jgi:spermidine/putrescine ABC transporter ATP-binding subunit